jgi:hypothetical protein
VDFPVPGLVAAESGMTALSVGRVENKKGGLNQAAFLNLLSGICN